MADCISCETLRETSQEFMAKGVTDNVANNLSENTGYGGKSTDCVDLNLGNDCLIGRMPSIIESYPDCDWKQWAKDFSGNVYNMLASIIAAICGLWAKIGLVVAPVKILYTRDVGGTDQSTIKYWHMNVGDRHTIDLYIDAKEGVGGTVDSNENVTIGKTEADRDYAVIVTHCFDMQDGYQQEYDVTWYCDTDTSKLTAAQLRERRAQHPEYKAHGNNDVVGFSWPITETVYVKKGHHLQCEVYCRTATPSGSARCRVHQIAATWIPISSVEVND